MNAQTNMGLMSEQLEQLSRESEVTLSTDELAVIEVIAYEVARLYGQEGGVDISFVDYDNSTISQMAEVWMNAALLHFGIEEIRVHSSGLQPDTIHVEALLTFERWGFIVSMDSLHPKPMLTLDYGSGTWNVFAKGIEAGEMNDLVLYVDQHCATHLHEKELSVVNSIPFILGTSLDCLDQSITEFAVINGNIGVKMFRLVERIEVLLVENGKIGRQRKSMDYIN